MKAVILAGGLGTRISEETQLRPKPLIEIGGRPILWHIMKTFSAYGVHEFVVCCSHQGYLIKEYFANYFLHMADATFDISHNRVEVHQNYAEPWKVTVVDTGLETMTGGCLLRVRKYLHGERFCLTYGDGVSDVNIRELIKFHDAHRRRATVTAIQPADRLGAVEFDGNQLSRCAEKPRGDGQRINGGYFILEPDVFNYLGGDQEVWEQEPLRRLAADGELVTYRHTGFWAAMETLSDKNQLDELWASWQ
jgi:glucose-1-phosphate cytidylyltransferase